MTVTAPQGSGPGERPGVGDLAARVVAALVEHSLTIATCESLTGGGVCAALTSVPGSSRVVRGGLVTYASDLKVSLAGVDADWVAGHGVINETTAIEMARGVLDACGARVGIACTGVAGPDGQDGHAPGEVWLAVAMAEPAGGVPAGDAPADGVPGNGGVASRRLQLCGDRDAVRSATVEQALRLVLDQLR